MDDARKRNLYPILKKVADAGGLLIGASAGSLMLTPSIESASDEDENSVGMTDFTGFSFVDFEFYPHWAGVAVQRIFLEEYKKQRNTTIYTCEDGGGIYVDEGSILTFGNTTKYV
jgi:dipeptidase E